MRLLGNTLDIAMQGSVSQSVARPAAGLRPVYIPASQLTSGSDNQINSVLLCHPLTRTVQCLVSWFELCSENVTAATNESNRICVKF